MYEALRLDPELFFALCIDQTHRNSPNIHSELYSKTKQKEKG
jgi:hypothetical protein